MHAFGHFFVVIGVFLLVICISYSQYKSVGNNALIFTIVDVENALNMTGIPVRNISFRYDKIFSIFFKS